ncbi:MAG: glycosyltransferase family 4 protein [Flavobacteriales bacterium]|nr:glycosyltransferase family 4 protein [Flavobacteriales bacterium]
MNVLRFALRMKKAHQTVTLVCVQGSPLDKAAQKEEVSVIHIERNKKYFDFSSARKIGKLFNELNVDVVWIRDTRDIDVCGWAKRFSKRKFKLLYQQAMQFGVSKKDPAHTFRFRQIDIWVAPLPFLADQVKKMTRFPKDRIHTIPLAVSMNRFKHKSDKNKLRIELGLPTDALLLGNIGRIDPLKGQQFLIESFIILAQERADLHLLIMGDPTKNEGDAFIQKLKAIVANAELDSRVHFLPHRGDVEKAFGALDIFAMTSVGETFGMVTIEAMASGLPIIGTNTSGTPDLLGHGEIGMLYAPGNIDAFNSHIRALFDEELRTTLSRKSKEGSRRFEESVVMESLLAIL